MRLAQEGLGEITLLDIIKGLACGKALDMEDAREALKINYSVKGSDDIKEISGSDIVVLTAGLARKPGMTREELLNKNALIVKESSLNIKRFAQGAILIVVTNPVDLMTRLALEVTGFNPGRVFGLGVNLDASRFANIISKELNIPVSYIEPCVIASHGEGMLPLPRLTKIKGVPLDEILDEKKAAELVKNTIERGHEIVTLLGSGSAYFGPSAAIAALVKAVAKDEKRIVGVSAYLSGEYGISDVCLGLPCRLGKNGIEDIVELELEPSEKEEILKIAARLKEQYKGIVVP
jgi:malate dehydrogenase